MDSEMPTGWPNGFGQLAASTGMCCQRTLETSRVVVRLHRTTDPPWAHLWAMFLCEQKGGSRAGRREKRFANLALAKKQGEGNSGDWLDQPGDSQT